ncbi:non-ribosomal peptide synthetase, partial [Streptomyces sp. NL15-2K]
MDAEPSRASRISSLPEHVQQRLRNRLAGRVRRRTIEPAHRDGVLPLSFAQQRLWFLEEFHPRGTGNNSGVSLRLTGELDADALRSALEALVTRHESLRTTFDTVDGVGRQIVHPSLELPFELIDLSGTPEDTRTAEGERLLTARMAEPYDLRTGPLVGALLVRLSGDEHLFLLSMHHIVTDGASVEVVLRELQALYAAARQGDVTAAAVPELPVQYPDFAVWQRERLTGDALAGHVAYWRDKLDGLQPLELPTDRPRPAVRTGAGAAHTFELPADVTAALRELSRTHGASLFVVLTALVQLLTARYSNQDDIAVGTAVPGRDRAELEDLVGFFINILALRSHVDENVPFSRFLADVRETVLEALDHQDVPFERLVELLAPERDTSRTPLVQSLVVLQNTPAESLNFAHLRAERLPLNRAAAQYDISWEFTEEADTLACAVEYSTDLFDAHTAAQLARHFVTLARAAGSDPERPLHDVPLLDDDERHRLLTEANATARPDLPARSTITGVFAAQAARTPEATALVAGGTALTYRELDERSSRLAHHLAELGVRQEDRVAVCLSRTADLVVALLAVLKAGAAYLPADPTLPGERIGYMLSDSGVRVAVTEDAHTSLFTGSDVTTLVAVDTQRAAISRRPAQAPPVALSPDSAAYVIYTSGSTGRPKGVVGLHGGLVSRWAWFADTYPQWSSSVVCAKSAVSFLDSATEIFGTLLHGGTVVLADDETAKDPAALVRLVTEHRVERMTLVPSLLSVILDEADPRDVGSCTCWISSGEPLTRALADRFRQRLPHATLLNLYGSSEVSADSLAWQADGGDIRAGTPIWNNQAYVLDRRLRPVPAGVPGELYIAGTGLARGYAGRPALTAERFVPSPFTPSERLFRTGDLARWTADGTLELLGRADDQVKVRGFRIEPGEVEAALRAHPAVSESAVAAREDPNGSARLVGYVVPAPDQDAPDAPALRAHVRDTLPSYMVPSAFVTMDRLPLTTSGKLDRRALPAPQWHETADYVAPRTATEEALAAIWTEVLGAERIGAEDDFFDLGGHSLLATRVISRIRTALGAELSLRVLFEAPRLADVAAAVDRTTGTPATDSAPLVRVARDGALPLSFAQERLWFLDDFAPGAGEYNVFATLRLTGALDVAALRAAVNGLVARHEALRTTFDSYDGQGVQVVHEMLDVPVRLVEPAPDHVEEALRREAMTPFDLRTGPLMRVLVVRESVSEHVLVLSLHHIVTDGWSMGVVTRELSALYAAAVRGEEAVLPGLPVQYGDYAVWQRERLAGDALEGQLGYWRGQLAGLEPLELPT